MADQLLTVEVVTELGALSTGLSKATLDITKFVNTSIPDISKLQKALNSLGVNTFAQGGLNQMKAELVAQRIETEKARTATAEFRVEQQRLKEEQKSATSTQVASTGSIAAARIELAQLGKAAVNATNSMNANDPIANKAIANYNNLYEAVKQAEIRMGIHAKDIGRYGKVWDGFSVGSKQAGDSLTNLNRIVQDAPYGFIGIQNNLNPMLESFQRLKAETGSNSSALKAMAGALTGPAGIGIALAVVGAGILLYQKWQASSTKADQEKEKALKNLKKTTEEYTASLTAVEQVSVKGEQNAQKDITSLRLLYEATQNLKLPIAERVKAAQALIDQYPATFQNFTTEQIMLGQTSTKYKELAGDILAVAKAAAGVDFIQDNTKKIIVEQVKYNAALKEQKKISDQLARLPKTQQSAAGSAGVGASSAADYGVQQRNDLLSQQVKIEQQINASAKEKQHLTKQNVEVEKMLTDQVTKTGKVVSLTGLGKGAKDAGAATDSIAGLRKEIALLSESKGSADPTSEVFAKITALKAKLKDLTSAQSGTEVKGIGSILKDLAVDLKQADSQFSGTFGGRRNDEVKAYQKAIDDLIKLGFNPASDAVKRLKAAQSDLFKGDLGSDIGKPGDIKSEAPEEQLIQPVLRIEPIVTGLTEMEKKFADLKSNINSMAYDAIGPALSNIGDVMGEALANGGSIIGALGSSLLKSFGGFLSEYGRLLIAYGVAAVLKGKLDAAALIPGAGLIAGPAAIAAGVALQIAGSAIGAFASGGRSKGDTGGQKNNGPQYGVPHFAKGALAYAPTLAMVGDNPGAAHDPEVISPLSKLKGMIGSNGGGNTTQVMIPEMTLRGQDIVVAFRRAEKNNARG